MKKDDLILRAAAIGCLGNSPEQMCMPWSEVERMLRELPAVDAAPVVHGRWVFHDDDMMPWVSCSECGVCTDSMNKTPYCPYCAAKMDGEADEH